VQALRRKGIEVINLAGGRPTPGPDCLSGPIQFPPERNVLGHPAGELDLRQAIAAKLQREQQLVYDPEAEVVVTIGAKQSIYASLLALIESGDQVLILDPCWVTYSPAIQLAGGVPVPVQLCQPGYRLEAKALESQVTRSTRGLILNTPHNPTGRVFGRDELAAVASFAIAHDLWVLADESFDKFIFDGRLHISLASLPGMRERTLTLQSFSKAYAIPGCRVGYLAAPASVCQAVARFNEQVLSCVSPIAQEIALRALSSEPEWTKKLQQQYQAKRDAAVEGLLRINKVRCPVPEGTFYAFPDLSALGRSSSELTAYLLEEGRIAVTAGSAFGEGGEGHIRVNLVGPIATLRQGLERMRTLL
jgi:aspartate/methionine/tyrosine aminotransferase